MASFKIAALLIKTLAKPVATTIKNQTKTHPKFRSAFVRFAQTMHRYEIMWKVRLLDQSIDSVRPLNDAKAVEMGANFLGESIVFSVAGGVILFEAWRSKRKTKKRHRNVDESIDALEEATERLRMDNDIRSEAVSEIRRELEEVRRENETLRKAAQAALSSALTDGLLRSPKTTRDSEKDSVAVKPPEGNRTVGSKPGVVSASATAA